MSSLMSWWKQRCWSATTNEFAELIWEIRNRFKYQELDHNLLSASALQSLGCVAEFRFDGGPPGRRFHPSTIGTLCNTVTSVQKIE